VFNSVHEKYYQKIVDSMELPSLTILDEIVRNYDRTGGTSTAIRVRVRVPDKLAEVREVLALAFEEWHRCAGSADGPIT
jgi:hypothetical protein